MVILKKVMVVFNSKKMNKIHPRDDLNLLTTLKYAK